MKKNILSFIAILIVNVLLAQSGFNYKALITQNGNALNTQSVNLKFTLLQNGSTAVYQETQSATTDTNGIVSVNIGEGTVQSGNFNNIDWENNTYSLKVEIDTGNGYQDYGTTELKFVPYAKYAEVAGNTFSGNFNDLNNIPSGLSDGDDVNDADHSPTNELQTLSINGTQLSISNGNSVTLPTGSGGDQWGSQVVQSDNSLNGNGTSASPLAINPNATIFNAWDKNASDDVSELNDLSDAKTDNTSLFLGTDAGQNNNANTANTGIGLDVLKANTSGNANTAIGFQALKLNTNGNKNTSTGYKSLYSNTTGEENCAYGLFAVYSNTTGFYNVGIGTAALYTNSTGSRNTAVGVGSLHETNGGENNTAVGTDALYSNISGSNNVAIGKDALHKNTIESDLVAIGTEALYNNGIGAAIGQAIYNTAVGSKALYANTKGNNNTAVGYNTLIANTLGFNNTAIGANSLISNTSGSYNVSIGSDCSQNITTGDFNVAIGDAALINVSTGTSNTAIGDSCYSFGNYSNSTAIGADSSISANNMVKLGDNSVTWIGGAVNWSTTSDGRFKQNVQENVRGLDFILKLRPVTYNLDIDALDQFTGVKHRKETEKAPFRMEAKQILHSGFIAQEVEQAAQQTGYNFDGVHHPANAHDPYSLSYAQFVVPLVKSVQEQQKIIEQQNDKIKQLEAENQETKKQIKKLYQLLQN